MKGYNKKMLGYVTGNVVTYGVGTKIVNDVMPAGANKIAVGNIMGSAGPIAGVGMLQGMFGKTKKKKCGG